MSAFSTETTIHPSAYVEPGAVIGENVIIEPFAVVKENVILEDNVKVMSHAYIEGNTRIGAGSTIYPFASIGTKTQDLKYRGEKTYVNIGRNTEIREYVTINSSCGEETSVIVGDNCLIMAYCHVAHNCEVGNHVIMSNGATLAGHVTVGSHAIIGGLTGVHQFSRIGEHAMVGGMSRVTNDIPPYTIGGGIPYKFGGLNLVGLKRHQFPLKTRQELSKAFRILFSQGLRFDDALETIERNLENLVEVQNFIRFCKESKRGILGLNSVTNIDECADCLES